MDERAELVERLFIMLEEVKDCAVDAQGEKKEFLKWLHDKAEKLLDMERELNEKCMVSAEMCEYAGNQ